MAIKQVVIFLDVSMMHLISLVREASPNSQPNFFRSHSPADAGLSSGDKNLVVHPTSLQNYPPPRPVIQMF